MKRLGFLWILAVACVTLWAQNLPPKHEFRGVWVPTVYNNYYSNLSIEQLKDTLVKQLDAYQKIGINTIIYQVRPEGDALYASTIEPWSRFLTGTQGQAPQDNFDPMAFLIEECHSRCMEFHAWINPYRANTNKKNKLSPDNRYYSSRYLYVPYGNQLLFNPGFPQNREHIVAVVKDIVSRYDIDALHMDDYFYPYPIKGLKFQDVSTYKRYAQADGFDTNNQLPEWRRNNVNLLVKSISDAIKATKPWVRFGISPFGIYRNKKQDEGGSETNGLSNYDDLYADTQLWINQGWIDYVIPQLYWEIGHPAANYTTLLHWWCENKGTTTQLYIGQSVERSVNQIQKKLDMTLNDARIGGNCYFAGDNLLQNKNGMRDSLTTLYYHKPAMPPVHSHIDSIAPNRPHRVYMDLMGTEPLLKWEATQGKKETDKVWYYAVYAFDPSLPIDITDMSKLVCFTTQQQCPLPQGKDIQPLCLQYVVTAIDRMHNESPASEPYLHTEE
ncbi:MAG: family 10 glycosylhydrolase [Paludibacteraceae bacterium]|nr:family 10 glycosylhydrolase [Paludibacteraceae bacterium]